MKTQCAVPYLILSFSLGLQDYSLRAFRFETTDNNELSVVPFASEANLEVLRALGFQTSNLTDWVAPVQPEELKVTISQTYYAAGPHAEQPRLLLEAASATPVSH